MPAKARKKSAAKTRRVSKKRSKKKTVSFWKELPKILFGKGAKKPARKQKSAERKAKAKPADRRKEASPVVFGREEENSIISPISENSWEAWQTFNPGALLVNDRVHFIYRSIGEDGLSRFGYASSPDGLRIDDRLPYPVYEHNLKNSRAGQFNFYSFASGGSFGGAEDPRITRVGDEDILYMTYTACDGGLGVALTSIKLDDFLRKNWRWKSPRLISPPGETHKNWVIFPEKINGKYAILTSINPKISIFYSDTLDFEEGRYITSTYSAKCRKGCWDTCVRGAGPPPIKTKYGWLLFYHATDERDPGKYKVGAMLLDLSDPTKVLSRASRPVLEPQNDCENHGFKPGVVYASGAVVKDGMILLYYGGADSNVCVAYANFDNFLEELNKDVQLKLEHKILTRKK